MAVEPLLPAGRLRLEEIGRLDDLRQLVSLAAKPQQLPGVDLRWNASRISFRCCQSSARSDVGIIVDIASSKAERYVMVRFTFSSFRRVFVLKSISTGYPIDALDMPPVF